MLFPVREYFLISKTENHRFTIFVYIIYCTPDKIMSDVVFEFELLLSKNSTERYLSSDFTAMENKHFLNGH